MIDPDAGFELDLRRWDGTITDAERAEAEVEIAAERNAALQAQIDAEHAEVEGPSHHEPQAAAVSTPESTAPLPVGRVRELPRQLARPRLVYGAIEVLGEDGQWVDPAHDAAVECAVEQLRVRDEARRLYATETAPQAPFDAGTLAEVLARAPEPLARVDGFLPWQAGLLLVAQRKAGKTTAAINLARVLVTGEPLFGSLAVRPIDPQARVAIINAEVSAAVFARWASEVGVPADRVFIVNTRGRRTPFASDYDLAQLAELLREHRVESILLDPFSRLFPGDDQNSNSEVGRFLDRLDVWARSEVGASDVILTAHSGHESEHVRGASTLEGWADSVAFMTTQGAGSAKTRFLRAEGRDIDLPESQLSFDPATRLLTLAGGSRADTKQSSSLDRILRFLSDAAVPMSGRAIHDALDDMLGGDHAVRDALAHGKRLGRIDWERGPRNSQLWSVVQLVTFTDDRGDDDDD